VDDLQDSGTVEVFLREKYLYWLEALSPLGSMSEGVSSIIKLERLLQVSLTLEAILISRWHPNFYSGKSRGVPMESIASRCMPLYSMPQAGNRE
jgi:hypothetical protein